MAIPGHCSRSTDEKLALFRACFTGLDHVYGTYDPGTGRVHQVKQAVTDGVLLDHLRGRQPYGVYLLMGDRTRAIVADFDDEDPLPAIEFIRQTAHYGMRAYLERSKRKGWHAWLFLEQPGVRAGKARLVVKRILEDIGRLATEIFPKHDHLSDDARFGNFINAPLWGRLVPEGRTVFVNIARGLEPYPDQWFVLASVERVSEAQLDEIVEINALAPAASEPGGITSPARENRPANAFGLPPCAQHMLAQGVVEFQRVACFRLALHLKKAGLPQDMAVACLIAWAAKNHPRDGKQIITPAEIIEQTGHAYARCYRGCGCEEPAIIPFCQPDCPLRSKAPGQPWRVAASGAGPVSRS